MKWTETTHPDWTPAAARAAGKTHMVASCRACGSNVHIPWAELGDLPADRPARESARRCVCRRCGARDAALGACAQSDAPGYVRHYRP